MQILRNLPSGTPGARRLIDREISIELSPDQAREFKPDPDVFKPGSRVFLTHLEGKSLGLQRDAAKRLLGMGYLPVPHLGARNFESAEDFVQHISSHSANGVREALFLGGNPGSAPGPFSEAADLLSHPVLADLGIRSAFLGGYPEGHPAIPAEKLAAATARKLDICTSRGLEPHIVSQFAFDGDAVAAWASELSVRWPSVRIRIGLAGVTSLPKLIKFAAMCGIGPSMAVLKRSGVGLLNVLADKNPSDVIEEIQAKMADHSTSLDLHFFPFGGWQKTLAWVAAYRNA